MNGESLNIINDRLEKLKADFPEIFSEEKIDMEKFKAAFTEDINFDNERYVLNWAGKSDAFKTLQIPTTATLKPQPEESVNFDTTENVFIEGENLEVLKVLQKSYYGKIKCIIIDPPYNTGNDSFIYPDSFKENKADYEKRIGDKDEEGYLLKEGLFRKNSKDSGHYHSNWLSMMYPRLFLAKNLLREDGVIFVHIDDNEVHNLRMIMNEIFGEENFVASFDWRKKTGANDAKDIAIITETILLFAKNYTATIENDIWERDKNSINQERFKLSDEFVDIRGKYYFDTLDRGGLQYSDSMNFGIHAPDGGVIFPNGRSTFVNDGWIWKWGQNKVKWGIDNKFLEFVKSDKSEDSNYTIKYKVYQNVDNEGNIRHKSGRAYSNLITEPINQQGNADFANLFNGKTYFSNPKPIGLIQYFLKTINNKFDIILDFFGGSGTTAQAVLELNQKDGGNRKFILVQLPELCNENSEAYKAGYKTIADISKERIRRVIKRLNHDSSDSEITMIKGKEKELEPQLLFEPETKYRHTINQSNHKNPINHSLDNGFKVFKLAPSNFKIWRGSEIDEENLEQQLEIFTNPIREGSEQENMLYELMLKAGYSLTDKITVNGELKIVNDELILLIETKNMQQAMDKALSLIQSQPSIKKVITLDILFKDNDQLKTNTVLQMRDAGVEFKTI
ncbi:MAG: site-specific DNA-methyltransferase [Chitinophagales bacterium]|nr:site-specific DNA-methyltransferase [Chitinophagales bacterium]